MPNILIDTQSKDIVVKLLNPHSKPVQMYKGMRIATLEQIDSNDIVDIETYESMKVAAVNEIKVENKSTTEIPEKTLRQWYSRLSGKVMGKV